MSRRGQRAPPEGGRRGDGVNPVLNSSLLRRKGWIAAAAIFSVLISGGEGWAQEAESTGTGAAAQEAETAASVESGARQRIERALRTADGWVANGELGKGLALLREVLPFAEAHGADTTPIRFLMAQALMRLRRHEEAAVILAKLVAEQPAEDRFVLDYAATLFALGLDDDARAVFRKVRSERELPPVVRRNVERFLERIRARQPLRIDFDLGFWHDNNVNNAPERETVEVPVFGAPLSFTLNEQPVSAWVARTGVQARWRHPLDDSRRVTLETRASIARNTALGASEHNRTWARASFGPRFRYSTELTGRPRPGMVLADVGAERRLRGGDGYATSLWTGLGVRQTFTRNWNAGLFTRLWATRYDGQDGDADPVGRSVAVKIRRGIGPGWLTVGGKLARAEPKVRNLRWTSRTVSLAYSADVGRGWNLSLRGSLIRTRFDDEHPLFRVRRDDRSYGAGLTVSHRSLSWEGYLPEFTLSWRRTASNIPVYDRKLRSMQVGLRRLF